MDAAIDRSILAASDMLIAGESLDQVAKNAHSAPAPA